ncbi:MAG: hypothetical protein LBL96_00780 [Clostridiales bacterium]|jgi:hypothetical protein|nr:hypothetical protein [Clostridiales bacterium]
MIKEIASHIYDMCMCSVDCGASLLIIEINEEPANDLLSVVIKDNRPMRKAQLTAIKPVAAKQPSLSVPVFRQVCDECGGYLNVKLDDRGCTICAAMQYSFHGRSPMGEIPTIIQQLMIMSDEIKVYYTHRYNGHTFQLSSPKIRSELDGVSLDAPPVAQWIKENIGNGLADIMRTEAARI